MAEVVDTDTDSRAWVESQGGRRAADGCISMECVDKPPKDGDTEADSTPGFRDREGLPQ